MFFVDKTSNMIPMININSKRWEDLQFEDITELLLSNEEENFFFEFKSDDITPDKVIKEISAFANTYGGYIFLGVNDDKSIGGCKKWTEQRIHTTVHDSITPLPNFRVKSFNGQEGLIFVIRIEEGTSPPYITNKGQIFQRVSSGSFPINKSDALMQLYHKSENELRRIKNKIEFSDINPNITVPDNLCAYLDLGFSVETSDKTENQKHFYKIDLQSVAEHIRSHEMDFSISQVGFSYVITINSVFAKVRNGHQPMLGAGINNYIEIMPDGSVKSRILIFTKDADFKADITQIIYINSFYANIYKMILGDDFDDVFISAHKYELLTVLKQFYPYYKLGLADTEKNKAMAKKYVDTHATKYGNNLIVESHRIPKNDYIVIDKKIIEEYYSVYNNESLIGELFCSAFFNLGFIDTLHFSDDTDEIN